MKTLYLLRHAKSSWGDASVEDHDRPLNARGIENATRMGQHMRASGYTPSLVLCSTSQRTRETLAHILPHLPKDCVIRLERALYLATPQRVLALLKNVEDEFSEVLTIAHSPGTEQCALSLARSGGGRDEEALRSRIEEKFPTAALAVLRLPAKHWRDVEPGSGELVAFVRPRDL